MSKIHFHKDFSPSTTHKCSFCMKPGNTSTHLVAQKDTGWTAHTSVKPVVAVWLTDVTRWWAIFHFFPVNTCADRSAPYLHLCARQALPSFCMLQIPHQPCNKRWLNSQWSGNKQRCKYIAYMAIQHVQQKATVTHSESHATSQQWICSRAENSAI